MITHAIAPYTEKKDDRPSKPSAFAGTLGSVEHKKYILERAITNCKLRINDAVMYRRSECTVTDILNIDLFAAIVWTGLSAAFVEILDNFGAYHCVNPGMLHLIRHNRRK